MTEEVQIDPVETTEVDVDPLITTKLTYVENLQKEIEGIQGQMASLQYQLDIRHRPCNFVEIMPRLNEK